MQILYTAAPTLSRPASGPPLPGRTLTSDQSRAAGAFVADATTDAMKQMTREGLGRLLDINPKLTGDQIQAIRETITARGDLNETVTEAEDQAQKWPAMIELVRRHPNLSMEMHRAIGDMVNESSTLAGRVSKLQGATAWLDAQPALTPALMTPLVKIVNCGTKAAGRKERAEILASILRTRPDVSVQHLNALADFCATSTSDVSRAEKLKAAAHLLVLPTAPSVQVMQALARFVDADKSVEPRVQKLQFLQPLMQANPHVTPEFIDQLGGFINCSTSGTARAAKMQWLLDTLQLSPNLSPEQLAGASSFVNGVKNSHGRIERMDALRTIWSIRPSPDAEVLEAAGEVLAGLEADSQKPALDAVIGMFRANPNLAAAELRALTTALNPQQAARGAFDHEDRQARIELARADVALANAVKMPLPLLLQSSLNAAGQAAMPVLSVGASMGLIEKLDSEPEVKIAADAAQICETNVQRFATMQTDLQQQLNRARPIVEAEARADVSYLVRSRLRTQTFSVLGIGGVATGATWLLGFNPLYVAAGTAVAALGVAAFNYFRGRNVEEQARELAQQRYQELEDEVNDAMLALRAPQQHWAQQVQLHQRLLGKVAESAMSRIAQTMPEATAEAEQKAIDTSVGVDESAVNIGGVVVERRVGEE